MFLEEWIPWLTWKALDGIESSSKVRAAVNAMRDLTNEEFMRALGKVSGDRLGTH